MANQGPPGILEGRERGPLSSMAVNSVECKGVRTHIPAIGTSRALDAFKVKLRSLADRRRIIDAIEGDFVTSEIIGFAKKLFKAPCKRCEEDYDRSGYSRYGVQRERQSSSTWRQGVIGVKF